MNELLASAFDAMPSPVFIVDEDVRILAYNAAASALLAADKSEALRMRGGEALHCIHQDNEEEGCGRAAACSDCVVRNSVAEAFRGGKMVRCRQKMELVEDGKVVEVYVLVTSTPFVFEDKNYAILVLEDISELVTLRNIIPICAVCKQVRTDENYWIQVETYLKDRLDIDFTHGLCPSCRDNYLEELKALKEKK